MKSTYSRLMHSKRGFSPISAGFLLLCALGASVTQAETLNVTVDIYSGRPNPSVLVTSDEAVAYLEEGLSRSPSVVIYEAEREGFEQLGYRGLIISRDSLDSAEGSITVRTKNGVARVSGQKGGDIYVEDVAAFEQYFLRLIAATPQVKELIEAGLIPDPDTM